MIFRDSSPATVAVCAMAIQK